ncbi:MAG: heparinase II/III family protein [Anaerolineae bacterium]|nr:heparinase II/III family protein [Anaerolineae bacterium]
MTKLKVLLQLLRYFGAGWVFFRVLYALKRRSGWLKRRFPAYKWSDRPLSYWLHSDIPATPDGYVQWRKQSGIKFFFEDLPPKDLLDSSKVVDEAEKILTGSWPYFTTHRFDAGMPPNWHRNPVVGQEITTDRHWSKISDFDAGDIKYVWEPNRFSVVYTLVRAFAITQNSKYVAAFWELIDDWAKCNPPQMGPNWKCGQEATFRVIAWCFGLFAFHENATPEQISQLVAMIAAHGDRIEGNINYARSQNNNHGVSEGVGLWTIGTLFPELKNARQWARKGKVVVEAEIRRQVYEDGSYSQYSPNYQRVMLHDALWALRLGELNNDRFSAKTYALIEKSAKFLQQILDHDSGNVPNHGSNDSAFVLPLSNASLEDFRPVIQQAQYLIHRHRIFEGFGEDLLWLFGPDALNSPRFDIYALSGMLSAETGGYYTLRGQDSWAMIRCAEYRARPHHADQLHVDFWWRGINICCDAGTYLYNGDPPWKNGLAGTAVHNTVTVDGRDQMAPYSHFLWLDWSTGRVHYHDETYWEGSHNGYERLDPPASHRRAIRRVRDLWIVVDEVTSEHDYPCDLHWLIPDTPFRQGANRIELQTPEGNFFIYGSDSLQIVRAKEGNVQGWRSRFYGQKEPALSLTISKPIENTAYLWTVLSPREISIEQTTHDQVIIDGLSAKLGHDPLCTIEES